MLVTPRCTSSALGSSLRWFEFLGRAGSIVIRSSNIGRQERHACRRTCVWARRASRQPPPATATGSIQHRPLQPRPQSPWLQRFTNCSDGPQFSVIGSSCGRCCTLETIATLLTCRDDAMAQRSLPICVCHFSCLLLRACQLEVLTTTSSARLSSYSTARLASRNLSLSLSLSMNRKAPLMFMFFMFQLEHDSQRACRSA